MQGSRQGGEKKEKGEVGPGFALVLTGALLCASIIFSPLILLFWVLGKAYTLLRMRILKGDGGVG